MARTSAVSPAESAPIGIITATCAARCCARRAHDRTPRHGRADAAGVGSTLGVSRTALYRHFTDKAALLAAVAGRRIPDAARGTGRAWEDGRRGLARIREHGVAYVRFAVAHPSHYRVMFGADIAGMRIPSWWKKAPGAFQVLVDALTELQGQDLVRRDDTQPDGALRLGRVHGVAMLAIDGRLGQHRPPLTA